MARDLIISGIPRGGTTLTAALIDGLPNAVCLNEPQWHSRWIWGVNTTATDFAKWLVGDFAWVRHRLLTGQTVPDRRRPDSTTAVTDYYQRKENFKADNTYQVINFRRDGLSKDFILGSKHNGLYVGALEEIVELGHFGVLVVLRHPIDAIASWRTLPNIPLYQGNMPGALRFWVEMREVVTSTQMDVLEKQVILYEMLCHRYYKLRERVKIVKYEDITQDPNHITRALGLPETLERSLIAPKPRNIPADELEKITVMLRHRAEYIHHFYDGF